MAFFDLIDIIKGSCRMILYLISVYEGENDLDPEIEAKAKEFQATIDKKSCQ